MGDEPRPIVGDAFGSALLAHLHGDDGDHVVERDDGFVETMTAAGYFAAPEDWPELDRLALDRATGHLLDAGAGAGRAALAYQERGGAVIAIDTSPGAVEVCSARGVLTSVRSSISDPVPALPRRAFDSILLLGNNLGILGSASHARRMFAAMAELMAPGGRVLGIGLDPHATDQPHHLEYQAWNRERGRLPGQIRLRVRHRRLADAWFDWLFLSIGELRDLAAASEWEVVEHTEPEPGYLAVLQPKATR